MLTVDIDTNSGFCAGVIRAIGKAEEFLKDKSGEGKRLYSLGAIVTFIEYRKKPCFSYYNANDCSGADRNDLLWR